MSKNNKKGFTIIEVVLVLAIAGLIFLMVFIALPALQRSQRNTQRRQDMSRIVSAVTQYQSNNKNNLPPSGTDGDWSSKYIGNAKTDQRQDPDGNDYKVTVEGWSTSWSAPSKLDYVVHIVTGAECTGVETAPLKSAQPKDFAVVYALEGGALTCSDNK